MSCLKAERPAFTPAVLQSGAAVASGAAAIPIVIPPSRAQPPLLVIPPTLNLENLDPEIDLDVVAGKPRPGEYRYAINNSFGFGGHNVAIAFGRY